MDLDQQGQTLGYYGRKRNELEKTEMLPKRRAQARLLLGLRRSSALVFCVKLMAEKSRKDGIFHVFTVKHRQGRAQTHPTESPPC